MKWRSFGFFAWSVGWPVLLTWAASAGHVVLSIVGIIVVTGTTSCLMALVRKQDPPPLGCPDDVAMLLRENILIRARSQFAIHEGMAHELELLSDSIRGIDPQIPLRSNVIADVLDARAVGIRSVSPTPPEFPLSELIREIQDQPKT